MTPTIRSRLWRLTGRIAGFVVNGLLDCASFARIARWNMLGRQTSAEARRWRILVVDEMVPDSRFGAGYPRAAEILHALVNAGWNVTMYPVSASRAELATIRARFAALPIQFVRSHGRRGLQRLMRENLDSFAVTLLSRPESVRIYSRIRKRLSGFRTHCVYDAEAIFAARDLSRRALFGPPMSEDDYERALDEEIALVAPADALITVTQAEANLFRDRCAKPVGVIKHSIAVRGDARGFDGRADLLFVGRCTGRREHSPNVDSLHWFVEEVMPLIDARMGAGYRLVIAGLADTAIVSALQSDRIVFLGVVDDLDAVYDRCRVFVAPTRFAAGIPLKIVEAAAAGIPCVVTSLLAAQLGFEHDVELMAAPDADAFASGCVALHEHPEHWMRVRNAARLRIRNEYSRATFEAAVREAVGAPNSWSADV